MKNISVLNRLGDTAQLACKTFCGCTNEQNDNATFVPDCIMPLKV